MTLTEEIEEMQARPLPKYVRLGGTTMKLNGKRFYWRPAGMWGVHAEWVHGVLMSRTRHPDLDKRPLIEITEEEFMKDNAGYVKEEDSDIKLAGDALELIRRTRAFTAAQPTGPIMEAHDALRSFIHGGEVNQ